MNYRTIIDALEERLADPKARKGNEDVLARVLKAKAVDDQGIVLPESTRTWLRAVWCSTSPHRCDRLDRRDSCEWLSKQAGIGVKMRCPFYERCDDPRGCSSYRPRRSKGWITNYRRLR